MKIIAGPCVIENEETTFTVAKHLKKLSEKFTNVELIFKSSYKKANRTKLSSFTSLGKIEALEILYAIKKEFNFPVLTDVHETKECAEVAKYVDYLQIPAFLCRQTELLVAAGSTGKPINIKKGQFMAPQAMKFAIEKVKSVGNNNIWLTERGTTFGYNSLIVDMTAIPTMKNFNVPVIIDATHAIQTPNQTEGITGGNPQMIETIILSAIAAGADGIFIETHPNPAKAYSDAGSQLQLEKLENILKKAVKLKKTIETL